MKKALLLLLSLSVTVVSSACISFKSEDTLLNPPSQTEKEDIISEDVTFYFPDEAVMYLCPEVRKVNTAKDLFLDSTVQSIIQGPASDELSPSVSGDVTVISATLKDGICTVDLSSEFSEFNTGGTTKETMAVYSIVNTLCSIDGIDKVKINIDGEESPDFGGHFSLDEPLEPDFSMIKE